MRMMQKVYKSKWVWMVLVALAASGLLWNGSRRSGGSALNSSDQGAPPVADLPDHEAMGHAALGRLSWPWHEHLRGWTIVFEPGGSGHGQTNPATRRIDVGVASGADVFAVARVAAHEIGHAADLTMNDTGARRAWKAQRGIPTDAPWWPSGTGNDFSTGAGDFAECFATWQLGSASLSAWGPCSAADLELLASMVSG